LIRARTARRAIGAALVDLEPGPAPARLRDALAKALGDPTLQLAFRAPGRGCYVDTRDVPIEVELLPAGRMLITLGPGAEAVLVHDDELRHEPEPVRVAAAAANLALEHSRLQAEIQAQLEQVRASRARIVEAGDTARRRLDRDLHDGAKQRLVTLSLALGMAGSQAAGVRDTSSQAERRRFASALTRIPPGAPFLLGRAAASGADGRDRRHRVPTRA
jgi:signal transduction histidine kinase